MKEESRATHHVIKLGKGLDDKAQAAIDMFRSLTGREPSDQEIADLQAVVERNREESRVDFGRPNPGR